MDWLEVFVSTSKEGLEIVPGLFYSMGLTGLIVEDSDDFSEFLNDPNRSWDYMDDNLRKEKLSCERGLTFYVRNNNTGIEQLNGIKGGLISLKENEKEIDLGSLSITVKNIKEDDWANNWKKYYKPFTVGKKLLVRPSWEEIDENTDKIVLTIDPGHVFGSGSHETTRLCLEELEDRIKEGDRVLDIGCGSGILTVTSLLLGASYAYGIDIDPNAVNVTYDNASMNNIDRSRLEVVSGNILGDSELESQYIGKNFDVVVANIVADIIIGISPLVPKYIKKDGYFIASGIITQRLDDVLSALKASGFEVINIKTDKDWAEVCSVMKG